MTETTEEQTARAPDSAVSPRFVIVTPCRDEEDHIEAMIGTMSAQTVRPTLWIIVDDGSTDRTPEILEAAAAEHDFIRVVRRDDRGQRKVGPGVIEAFYTGLEAAGGLDSFDFLCKLDADLELPPRYFELVLAEMRREPLLGNYSGKVQIRMPDGQLIDERTGDENANGQAKFYRVPCFKQIGGFVRESGWDGIDGHMCRMHGWIAKSEDRPELRMVHRRLMGSSEVGIWTGRKRWGMGKYFMGSSLLFVLAVAAYRSIERPFVVGGFGILYGYIRAWLDRKPRIDDARFRKHLRRYEMQSLLRGKRKTADRYHDQIRVGKTTA